MSTVIVPTLFVHSSLETEAALADNLLPSIQLSSVGQVASLHEALAQIQGCEIGACFIEGDFSPIEFETFFRDVKSIAEMSRPVFIQIVGALAGGEVPVGFDLAMGCPPQKEQTEALRLALQGKDHLRIVEAKIQETEVALTLLLRELDDVARQKGRGMERKFTQIANKIVDLNAEFDDKILQRYFEQLISVTDKAEPFVQKQVTIPAEVLMRKLPKLHRRGYDGASSRVWEKLLRRYGYPRKEG